MTLTQILPIIVYLLTIFFTKLAIVSVRNIVNKIVSLKKRKEEDEVYE